MTTIYRLVCIVFCCTNILFASDPQGTDRIDTTYTISSTAKNILKDYPGTSLVIPYKPADISVDLNAIYKKIGKRELSADIYYSQMNLVNKKPAIIMIHGGGWRSGNKLMEQYTAIQLASLGYFCIAIEYRLSPEAVYPAAVIDILDAVNWVKENGNKYSADTSKIVLMGESAGGHLASLAGIKWEYFYSILLKKQGCQANISAIINIDGVMDMTVPSESGKDTIADKPSAAKQWIGYTFNDRPELWKGVSPVNYIDKNTPPMLFINSSMDRFHAGRDEAIEKMRLLNIYSEVHSIPDSPHSFWFFHPWIDEALNYIKLFLDKVF